MKNNSNVYMLLLSTKKIRSPEHDLGTWLVKVATQWQLPLVTFAMKQTLFCFCIEHNSAQKYVSKQ